jgi:hypothetical protein
MEREDWTPAVLITASLSLLVTGLVWIWAPWNPGGSGTGNHTIPRHGLPPEVVVWTGEVAPGLKAVVGPVWGDDRPDRLYDSDLNRDLGLTGDRALSWFRLLVFNTSKEDRILDLEDGRLVMRAGGSGPSFPLKSLARMAQRGEVRLDKAHEFTLRSLGALVEHLDIPAGEYARLVVCFRGAPRIDRVASVATAQGSALHRRPMARITFRRLLESPDETRVKDL